MKADGRISNYERMKNQMADVFLQYDQEPMIRKFRLRQDERYLYIRFLGREYRICRLSGRVCWTQDGFQTEREADYNEVMTIYDVLCHSQENCGLAHQWVNVGSLATVQGGTLAKRNHFFQNAGDFFDWKTDALACACESCGGEKVEKGDVAYKLELFPFLPILLCFWESDEEFPASLQILVDKNTLQYMHYETLMFAIAHLLERLKEEIRKTTKADGPYF